MLGYIDRDLKPEKSRLFLCKPDKTTIAELTEAYNKELNTNYNGIHELTFDIPFIVEKNHKFIRNKHIDMIRGHYLIRYKKGNTVEYFVIVKPKNSTSDGKEVKNVQCFLLPYELNRKIVRDFKGTKQLYNHVGNEGILNETLLKKSDWSVGYIDPDIALKYRTLDISEQGLIEFIGNLSEMFDAVIIWDTINKRINFYKNENIGTDKGLSIEYGKYLKSLDEEPDFDNVVTRLYVYGNNGISISSENPTGTDYIESFDYYMYPFERDSKRKVIKHSNYLSDSLCHALLDYQALIESKQGEFASLLEQKKPLQETLLTKQNELFVLETQLDQLEDNLAVANATQQPTQQIIIDRDKKLIEVNAKKNEIETVKGNIATVDNQIINLKNVIAIENNFTRDQIIERNQFINEKVWSNTNIFKTDELYKEGVKQLQKINQPLISYSINVIDFLNVVECQRDWKKLILGDIITVRYPNFGIDIKAKIIGIKHGEDNNNLSLEIANTSDIKNGFMTLKELFNKTVQSSTQIDMSKYKWDMSEENNSEIRQILDNEWSAIKNSIIAGVEESVEISRKGIVIKSPVNPMSYLVLQHGLMAITNDNGNSWKHAITDRGIIGETIIGKLIMGENLIIGDDKGTFLIKGNLLTIKDNSSRERVKLGEYSTGKFGLQLKSKNGNDVVLDEDGILQTWQEGRTDNVDGYNPLTLYVYVPSETISIKKAILRFKILQFRAYSTAAASGGSYSTTTSSGGGTYTSTESGGGDTKSTLAENYQSGYGHNHGIPNGTRLATHPTSGNGYVTFVESAQHTHSVSIPSHSHYFSVPSHYHDVYIGSHSHDIEYGIYKGTNASQVSIHINGINRDVQLGGKFNSDRSNLDITSYLQIGQWNQIDLYSSQLGRIDATVFIQSLMGY